MFGIFKEVKELRRENSELHNKTYRDTQIILRLQSKIAELESQGQKPIIPAHLVSGNPSNTLLKIFQRWPNSVMSVKTLCEKSGFSRQSIIGCISALKEKRLIEKHRNGYKLRGNN